MLTYAHVPTRNHIPAYCKHSSCFQSRLPNQPFGYLTYAAIAATGRFRPLLEDVVLGRRPADQQLLAAACTEERSVPLPSALGVVGKLPKRAMQVGRGGGRVKDGVDRDVVFESPGATADVPHGPIGGISHDD